MKLRGYIGGNSNYTFDITDGKCTFDKLPMSNYSV